MKISETTTLLQTKITKILTLLLLVRLGLYIPVPNVDLDIFSQGQAVNPMFSFARTLTGSSFLGIGSLGILPYINSSIIIQLLTSVIPSLERLQKEEGELGRQKISRYTRYLTFGWAIILSAAVAFILVKPIVFNWNLALAVKIIVSLTTGSLLSMWFAELITEESLGNGSSMIIFINIVGSIPNSFSEVTKNLAATSYLDSLILLSKGLLIYLFIVFIIVLFQDAYKKISIVSAKQLNVNSIEQIPQTGELKNSYIPIKLNQGGIMPLVFSSTVATFLYYPVQLFANSPLGVTLGFTPLITSAYSFLVNIILVIFFSGFYALLVLKPNDISQNLAKMAYSIPGIRQGNQTTQYLKQTVTRLAFMGGLFLAFLAFFPLLLGNVFQFSLFKNVTSLLILVGVITDTTAQIRGYLISRNYEGFKKP
jgi:preprotein translocase subunit SecY